MWPLDSPGAQGDTRPDPASSSHAVSLVAKGAAGRVPLQTTGPTWGWRRVGTGHKTPFGWGPLAPLLPPWPAGARARGWRQWQWPPRPQTASAPRAAGGPPADRPAGTRYCGGQARRWGGHARDSWRFRVCWRGPRIRQAQASSGCGSRAHPDRRGGAPAALEREGAVAANHVEIISPHDACMLYKVECEHAQPQPAAHRKFRLDVAGLGSMRQQHGIWSEA